MMWGGYDGWGWAVAERKKIMATDIDGKNGLAVLNPFLPSKSVANSSLIQFPAGSSTNTSCSPASANPRDQLEGWYCRLRHISIRSS